ncbi:MAG: hypothetical protein MJB57_10505 [Gemmatimonadetes bacterium]|nr:hypothetical protein [Gemmatimonadota bacterium]
MRVATSVLAVALALAPIDLAAQDGAEGERDSGAYFGAVFKLSEIIDQTATFLGARAGLIHRERLGIGLGAYALLPRLDAPFLEDPINNFAYGGVEVEYTAWTTDRFHVAGMFLFGLGRRWRDQDNDDHDEIFVYEPTLRGEIELGGPFLLEVGGGYRFVTRITSRDTDNGDFSAPLAVVAFRLGPF